MAKISSPTCRPEASTAEPSSTSATVRLARVSLPEEQDQQDHKAQHQIHHRTGGHHDDAFPDLDLGKGQALVCASTGQAPQRIELLRLLRKLLILPFHAHITAHGQCADAVTGTVSTR